MFYRFIKFFLVFYLYIFIFGIFFMPVRAQAQTSSERLKYCWTAEQCLGPGGQDGECTNKKDEANYCFKLDAEYCIVENLGRCFVKPENIKLQVSIPSLSGGNPLAEASSFPVYLQAIYAFFVAAAGIVAVTYIAFGGYQWIVAAGNAEQISQAKNTIQGALIGLLLAVGSYVILNLINERLVNIDSLRVDRIKPKKLATLCTDDSVAGIDDWVVEGETGGSGIIGGETKCGTNYVSLANPNNTCIGIDQCPEGEYCIVNDDTDEYKCQDIGEIKDKCNDIEDVYKYLGKCDAITELYRRIGVNNLVCKLTPNSLGWEPMWTVSANNDLNIYKSGVSNYIEYWKYIFREHPSQIQKEAVTCTALEWVEVPSFHTVAGDWYRTTRIDCNQGGDLCYDYNNNTGRHHCVDLSFSDIGKGFDRMCVYMSESPPGQPPEAYICANEVPEFNINDCTVCAEDKLDFKDCKYKLTNINNCNSCGQNCYVLVCLASN